MGRFDGKTEKATPLRRRQAREEGTVARSAEVNTAVALLAAAFALRLLGPAAAEVAASETRALFHMAAEPFDGGKLLEVGLRMAVGVLAPFLAVSTVAALGAGVAQVGFRVTPKALKPKLSHISPKKGLEKFKPNTAAWEVGRTAIKLGALVAVAWHPVRSWIDSLDEVRSLDEGLTDLTGQLWVVLLRAVVVAIVLAAADYAWNRHRTDKQMRMSKEEVKREHRDTEGDPMLRAQRRRRQQDLSRNRMLLDVALADVVVTNPTHLAVALRYDPTEAAPRVLARGADHLAKRIRSEAYRNGVPVTEDKPLARSLYRQCKVGQTVPAALYEAVAVVLALAYRRTGRVPGGREVRA